ncbi:hypothetical protein Pcinc_041298 [Petrolisthes cinctipes]|uniref:Uncharacterized protein n=1 Tax=Petrolisthes cinctipes TaxID=88211 RepID=A0AAE1BNI3_PETCI|nr:hypothetical protein Pcinc_041298 [Petrolisthes cinctipes]
MAGEGKKLERTVRVVKLLLRVDDRPGGALTITRRTAGPREVSLSLHRTGFGLVWSNGRGLTQLGCHRQLGPRHLPPLPRKITTSAAR